MTQTDLRVDSDRLCVENVSRGQVLVTAGEVADSAWTRFRGLLGRDELATGEGLMIVPCKSVHTHFMRFPIDVLYVDAAHEVVGIDHALKPWRFGQLKARARFVLELPAGTARATDTQVGDQLRMRGYPG